MDTNWKLMATAAITLVVVVVLASIVIIYPAFLKIQRRSQSPRPDGLEVISNPTDAKFEMVAVHGLGAHPEYTWMSTSAPDRPEKVHLLRDLLKVDFAEARIPCYAYNCDWLIDAPVKTIQEMGGRLRDALGKHRSGNLSIPIIFIGHSFGGIIIKQALCESENHDQDLVDSTRGIVFLGTPHTGSEASRAGYIAARLTNLLGSNSDLLFTLTSHQKDLSDLEDRFINCMNEKRHRKQETNIVSFYETKPTYMLGRISLGTVVSRDSARGSHSATIIHIDTDHSGLNKCHGRDTQLYQELHKQLHRLRLNATPSLNSNQNFVIERLKLNVINDAAFDSHANEHNPTCLEGTRRELLQQIDEWSTNSTTHQPVYWLQGKAGTGKSTIARTIASKLANEGRLAASFFKRGEGDRGNARCFFTTISNQLVQKIPKMAEHVRNAIQLEPDITGKSLKDQFAKLILKPIEAARCEHSTVMTIVIDALDECEGDGDIKVIIHELSRINSSAIQPLKFFVSSRFEPPIRLGFEDIRGHYAELPLHETPEVEIERDIAAFLHHRLEDIRKRLRMASDWPSQAQFQKLLRMAIPLFIFAATACRFIEDERQVCGGPDDRLEDILQHQTQGDFDSTYLPALKQMVSGLKGRRLKQVMAEFGNIVGSIVTLATPLTAKSLTILLGEKPSYVQNTLGHLHSVLDIPADEASPVRLFHESFRDFLTQADQKDTHDFWIDKGPAHKMLASRCLVLLSSGRLKDDICGLEEPGKRRDEINSGTIERCLPPEVRYSCLHWVHHLKEGVGMIKDNDHAHNFLQSHFLHWLEALSLLGRVTESTRMIRELQSMAPPPTDGSKVGAFLQDAERFTLYILPIIESAPLQLYYSALLFSPGNSIIRQTFQKHVACEVADSWPNLDWSPRREVLNGHTSGISTVAFSTDGQRILSTSNDNTIRIWKAGTSACIQTLEGHTPCAHVLQAGQFITSAIAFLPDGQRIAIGSGAIRIWDIAGRTGKHLETLQGHTSSVAAVAFSPDGQYIASGSRDCTIRIWNATTRASEAQTPAIPTTTEDIYLEGFSIDGKWALSHSGSTIMVWDTHTGICMHTRDVDRLYSFAFSADGRSVAYTTYKEMSLFLCDVCTDTCNQMFGKLESRIEAIAFSTDGKRVAAQSCDKTAKVWHVGEGTCIRTFDCYRDYERCTIAFSADGQRIALLDKNRCSRMKIYDVDTGACLQTIEHGGNYVHSVAISADNQWVAASLVMPSPYPYQDCRVQLWNVDTGICAHIFRVSDRMFTLVFDPTTNSRLKTDEGILDIPPTSNQVQSAEIPLLGDDYLTRFSIEDQ